MKFELKDFQTKVAERLGTRLWCEVTRVQIPPVTPFFKFTVTVAER